LAPSTHDVENIFEILKNFKCEKNFQIVLSPHPVMNLIQLKKYQEYKYPNLKIIYVDQFKTLDLVCASDLIVTSASSIAVEALMFNKISVRFMSLGDVPKFDYERNIPTFYSSDEFNNWFKKNIKLKKSINKKKIIQKYFTKIDSKINVRFDKYISEVINY
jgi:UDP-N-acetylglucosamine 2-epimerase